MAALISMPTMKVEVERGDSAVEGGEARGDVGDLGDLGGDLGDIGELLLKFFTHSSSAGLGLASGAARPATGTLASVSPLG